MISTLFISISNKHIPNKLSLSLSLSLLTSRYTLSKKKKKKSRYKIENYITIVLFFWLNILQLYLNKHHLISKINRTQFYLWSEWSTKVGHSHRIPRTKAHTQSNIKRYKLSASKTNKSNHPLNYFLSSVCMY